MERENSSIFVVKRDGTLEELNLDKIHKVVQWACDGLTGVSQSEIEIKAKLQIKNRTKTKDIHETLIKSASELICEDTPNYQYVAARLINYQLRKEVYGRYEPWTVKQVVDHNVNIGVYTKELLENFDDNDWLKIEKIVKHQRDNDIAYAGMEQYRGKYLVRNRITKQYYETPQIALILIAALGFMNYPKETRMEWIKDMYDAISLYDISLPTPIMAALRTPTKQFSSCTVIAMNDSLESIFSTSHAVGRYIAQKAGIGLDVSRVRAIGSAVRLGDTEHTGLIPFLKLLQSSVKSCSQGSTRGGSATCHYQLWHYEFEDLIVLKNNKGTENNRVRHMDYSVLFNRLMYQRLIEGGDITFFSPKDVPGLLEAFWADQDEFDRLYVKYENDSSIRKKSMKALDVFSMFLTERKETGRIYLMNIDHVNNHGSFIPELAPITQSNLCQEIGIPSLPFETIDDDKGEIALCTLSANNWANVKNKHGFEKVTRLTVRFLDELLTYQQYPVKAAELSTMAYRPLGVGIVNLAYFLAKNGVKYDNSAFTLVDEYAEAWSYYLIRASVDLAKEKGPCLAYNKTKYSKGIVPIDTRKLDIDEIVPHNERMPWKELREDLLKYGIRNATLMACMPAETSAQLSNSTNGIEPVRALVSEKVSKHGILRQVVPEIRKLKNEYDLLWDQKSPKGYMMISCILQKYIDQSISCNTSYNPQNYSDNEISIKDMIIDLLTFYKYGGKNLYYFNTYDGQEGGIDFSEQYIETKQLEEAEECSACVL